MYGYNTTGNLNETEGIEGLCCLVKVEMVVVLCRQSLYDIQGYDATLMAYPQPQHKATHEPIDQSKGYWEPSIDDQKTAGGVRKVVNVVWRYLGRQNDV
jgi:hypothetical protein